MTAVARRHATRGHAPGRRPAGGPRRRRLLPTLPGARRAWPLTALCIGMPVWFFLGGAAAVWSIPGIALGADLLRRRRVHLPPGAPLLLALLVWIALSGVQVRGVPAMGLFTYRFSIFLSLAVLYVWLTNVDERTVPTRTIVHLLAGLWLVLVAFGYVALFLPGVEAPSLVQAALPGALRADAYVQDLTSIRFAEAQGFLGYLVPRPSAPMTYANGWGSTLGLLTPFFVLGWLVEAPPARRRVGWLLLVIGLVPAIVSLNRGLWLSAGVAVAYVAGRNLLSGETATAVKVVAGGVALVAFVTLTPLWDIVGDKVSGASAGDATRASVYEEAFDYALRSPLLGYGAPVSEEHLAVAVGTHGLLWFLMVSHGFPAVALFGAWIAGMVRRGVVLRTPTGTWATAAVVVCAFQVPIYGLLPQLALAGTAAAVVWRERVDESR